MDLVSLLIALERDKAAQMVLEELHRLGESESKLVYVAMLQFACAVLDLIPRTAIRAAILVTGFMGAPERFRRA